MKLNYFNNFKNLNSLIVIIILYSILITTIYSHIPYTTGQLHNYSTIDFELSYAKIFYDESTDSTLQVTKNKKESDIFYYVLGILILMAAGFILKQRYAQYLKEKDTFLK